MVWLVMHYEERLTPEQREVWAELVELAGGSSADPCHLLGLLAPLKRGASLTMLRKMANRRGVDIQTQTHWARQR